MVKVDINDANKKIFQTEIFNQFHSIVMRKMTEHPPSSISAASAKIEELTGIVRSESAVRKFLKDLNFRYRKAGSVPSKTQTESKKKNSSNFWTHRFYPE